MKKRWIVVIGSGALAISLLAAGITFADSDEVEITTGTIHITAQPESEFPAMAKITLDQAMKTALETVQGRILKAELEAENGFLVYSVEVAAPDNTITDVKIDAGSGAVLAKTTDTDQDGHEEEENESGD